MRHLEPSVNVTVFMPRNVPALPVLLCSAAMALLAGCAPRSCANPYVLDFLDQADARADVWHAGILHDPVVTAPGATPDLLRCSVWEQVRRPGDGRIVLRPQYFTLRHLGEGWEIAAPSQP
ncbi:hypothetical protein NFI95_12335 [Acetobacteraceae bacterium KSS8]|uniref:Lipoprotein n=1 Tax=Endosaccharibacter trunci TaxID=2812733 RepID=A0ABT1W8K9_9PROT|nr:hypothetical protein [Acetobacteraceae bacterium KSS8]